jgi:hypothetical protein
MPHPAVHTAARRVQGCGEKNVTSGENRDVAGGENGEEAAWRDLIAHYNASADGNDASPWPEREDLTGHAGTGATACWPERAVDGPELAEAPCAEGEEIPDEDHYIPPPPPPLPRLDPVTKGAWAGLFGGPAYLLVASAAGWTIPGVAAFCAIGAFVGGFAILVLRMGDDPRGGSGPDDGAVV